MAVMRHLVPGLDELSDRLRMALRGGTGHGERSTQPMLAEQLDDPRESAPNAELVLGQRPEPVAARLELRAEARLGVHVEGQADRGHARDWSSNPYSKRS